MDELLFNTLIAHVGYKVTYDIVILSSSSAGEAIKDDL